MSNKQPTPINIADKLDKFSEHWSPKIIAQINDHQFKLVKFKGEFVWHKHDDTDEVFIVINGSMRIEFRDSDTVTITAGEMIVVPKGVEHRPVADDECHTMLLERSGTINTGDIGGDMTAPPDDWI
jgi:mannose-6-phosphate isomerase-like protein (cupin superfamily)